MSWWKFWETKPEPQVVQPQEKVFTTATEPFIKVSDYPAKQYRVYWETIINLTNDGAKGEVRFMSRSGQIVEQHSIEAPTAIQVEKLAAKLIKEKMDNFKV